MIKLGNATITDGAVLGTNWFVNDAGVTELTEVQCVTFRHIQYNLQVLTLLLSINNEQMHATVASMSPALNNLVLDAPSFSVAAPKIWNSASAALFSRTVPTLSTDTSKLIAYSKPFYPHRHCPPCASDSAIGDIVHVYKFYLLTYFITKNKINA